MRYSLLTGVCFAVAMAFSAPALAQVSIAEAVASPDRYEGALVMDEGRKPAEVLAWARIEAGMDVADIMPGLGYWTEIMAPIVGPEGSVAALQPEQFYNEDRANALWDSILAANPGAARVRYPFDQFSYAADSFDLVLINNSYHDIYWQSEQYRIPLSDPDVLVTGLFAATRPGGHVVVIDHAADAGSEPRASVDAMHRIAADVVIADFERAGFVLVDRSDLLANPADDHTRSVFDEALDGYSDRFMLKFRKPAA
ncbi:class I SAM-dependent methyltransferase [Aurantiacibacter gilvus]|uniref:Methyltransferase n=1 Tax=Aurantiacibacter gilvus TaxID=3139141 RepID=A0ABU9IEQ1_9SPHN